MSAPPLDRPTNQDGVRRTIRDNAIFDTAFVVMNALATIVACYGLLEDSAAVIIGAMVIATLLGPIFGIALALVDADNALLGKALAAAVGGGALILFIALLVGAIHQDAPLTREILSRTRPALFDLFIALAGGAAGAYATVSPRVSAGLVGVAIATALVPPLSACGLCLGRGEAALALGAFLLFLSNLVAIQVAASLVLWLCGFSGITSRPVSGGSILLRNALSFGILLILAVVLGLHVLQTLTTHLFETKVRARLLQGLLAESGVELVDLRIRQTSDKVVVIAEVKSPRPISPEEVADLEARLPKPAGRKLELIVQSILIHHATRKGSLHQPSRPNGGGRSEPAP